MIAKHIPPTSSVTKIPLENNCWLMCFGPSTVRDNARLRHVWAWNDWIAYCLRSRSWNDSGRECWQIVHFFTQGNKSNTAGPKFRLLKGKDWWVPWKQWMSWILEQIWQVMRQERRVSDTKAVMWLRMVRQRRKVLSHSSISLFLAQVTHLLSEPLGYCIHNCILNKIKIKLN